MGQYSIHERVRIADAPSKPGHSAEYLRDFKKVAGKVGVIYGHGRGHEFVRVGQQNIYLSHENISPLPRPDWAKKPEREKPPRPSYKTNDPRGWGGNPSRGAALGRSTRRGPEDFDGKLTLRQVRLDSGGYDQNGTYFGHGNPLYWYASDDGEIDGVLRAHDRDDAKAQVLKLYPRAKFLGR